MWHYFFCRVNYLVSSLLVCAFFKVIGVQLNGIVWFCGLPYIVRGRNAKIEIGSKCRFMSKEIGNLIGLTHRCILSAEKNAQIEIADGCCFSGVSIRSYKKITIERNVRCGANVTVLDGDAHFDDPRSGVPKPILIKKNAWLGANVLVLKGVTIGENSVIGAGSVVTKDIPDNVIAAGNPCRVIRSFSEETKGKLKDYLS